MFRVLCLLSHLTLFLAVTASAQTAANPDRFEKTVLAYEAADRTAPPPQGAILLAGDSQFFRWKTVEQDLIGYTVVNRGIDSFQLQDLLRYTDRLVLPHKPRMIILHVGGNDVHNGKTPAQLLADFQTFVAKVHATLPGVPIAFSSITPGPGRWDEAPQRKEANRIIKEYVATQPGLHFIDLWDAMLTPAGQPREDLWVEDRVHPNHAGYLLRVKIMLPLLGAPDQFAQLPNVTLQPSEVIRLWPGDAPGETGRIGPEHIVPERPRPFDQITDVSIPTLSVFPAQPYPANGTAVLIIPGGGLERLAIEHEGYEIAEWLNARGFTAFLLKYRVPPRDPAQRWKVGLQDAQRAMGLIRANAAQWHVDPTAIGAMGFSAGAELNVMLSVYHAEPRQYPTVDAADAASSRPDFNIAIYGGGFANPQTGELRPDIAARLNKDTPPMFIAHAFDDQALSSTILLTALKKANLASELHIFAAGGHGFGHRNSGLTIDSWGELCLEWLDWQGYLDAATVRGYARDFAAARTANLPKLPRFSASVPAARLSAAYGVQKRLVRQAQAQGDAVAGYRAAYVTPAAQAPLALRSPLPGVLLKSGRIDASPAPTVALDPAHPIFVETGIGYVIATDIGTALRVPRQALSAVEAIVPVVELPDNFAPLMDGKLDATDAVATNLGSRRFIVGAPVAPKVAGDPDQLTVSLQHDGQTLHQAAGAEVQGGQAANLMSIINEIVMEGRVLHRGDLIICGALGGAQPGVKGRYVASFGPLGTIEFKLE